MEEGGEEKRWLPPEGSARHCSLQLKALWLILLSVHHTAELNAYRDGQRGGGRAVGAKRGSQREENISQGNSTWAGLGGDAGTPI